MKPLILSIILFLITFSYTDTTKIKKNNQLTLLTISKNCSEKPIEKSDEKNKTQKTKSAVDLEKQISYQNFKLDSIIQKIQKK